MSKNLAPVFRPRRSSLRAPYSWSEAAQILDHQRASGLTVAGYGKLHGLELRQLYDWRAKLGLSPTAAARAAAVDDKPPLPAFVPIVAALTIEQARASPAVAAGASGVELAIGDIAIRLGRGFCSDTLNRAIAVLTGGAL